MSGDYNAGSIDATLNLDRTRFNQELDQAKRDVSEFVNERRTVNINVDADLTETRQQLRELQAQMSALRSANIGVNVDTSGAASQLERLNQQAQNLQNSSMSITLNGAQDVISQLEDIQRRAEAVSNTRINIKADADTSAATTKLADLMRQVSALDGRNVTININADAAPATTRLRELQARVDQLSANSINITANADTAEAEARLAALDTAVRRVDGRSVNVRANVDSSSASSKLDDFKKKMDSAAQGSFSLMNGLMVLSPLFPMLATAILGASTAIASFGAAAAGGLVAFGAAAFGATKMAQNHAKAVENTGVELRKAQAELAKTTAGTDQYNAALKKVTEMEQAHAAALSVYTPLERQFNDSLQAVKNSWTQFIMATERYTLQPMVTVLQAAQTALPKVIPLVAALAPVFQDVADQLARFLTGNGFEKFIGFIQTYGVPILRNLIDFLKNLMVTLGNLISSFGPQANQIGGWFQDIGAKMRSWTDNNGVERFKASFLEAWNRLKPVFEALWDAVKRIWEALSNAGGSPTIQLLTVLGQIVSILPPSVLQVLIQAWIAYKLALMAWAAVAPLVSTAQWLLGSSSIAAAAGMEASRLAALGHVAAAIALATWSGIVRLATMAWTAANWLLTASFLANPITWVIVGIAALVAAIVLIATKTTWFQTAWEYTWNAVKAVASAVWGFLQQYWQYLILILGPVGWLIDIATHWSTVWNGIKSLAETVWGWLQTAWQAVTSAFATAWNAVANTVTTVWNALVNNVFNPIVNFFTQTIPNAAQNVATFVSDRWHDIQNAISAVWEFLRSNIFEPLGNFFTQTIPNAAQTLANFVHDRWMDIQNIIQAVFNFVRDNIFNPIGTFFTQTIPEWSQTLFNFVRDRWNDIQNTIQAVFNFVRDNIFNPLGTFFTQTIPSWAQTLKDFVSARWEDLKNAIKATWDWIVNNIFSPVNTFFTQTIPGWATTFKDKVVEAFNLAKDGIKKAWDLIQDIVKAPVTFIVETVYNKGIRGIWNNTAGKIGLPTLDEVHFAEGGQVPMSMGTPGKDSVRAMLMPGEHVLTTRDVQAMGGQENVYKFREQLQGQKTAQERRFADGGAVQYYADGGPVVPYGVDPAATNPNPSKGGGVNPQAPLNPITPPGQNDPQPARGIDDAIAGGLSFLKDVTMTVIKAPVKAAMDAMVHLIPEDISPSTVGLNIPLLNGLGEIGKWPRHTAQSIEDKILDFMQKKEDQNKAAAAGNGYTPWEDWKAGDETRVNWGGVTINRRTAAMMDHAKGVFGAAIQAIQGSYSTSVGASAGTHAGGGAIDVGPAKDELVGAMRASGFAAWHRTVAQGFSGDHIHGIAVGDKELSPEAAAQVTAFFAGKNGLADNGPDDYHPPGGPGGVIPTGDHLSVINQALQAAGVPPPGDLASWQAGLNTLIERESGWNPNAVNNSDSNAAAGTPSIGLAQVIQPTFDAYKVPGLTNIYNPVANVAAAIRYIVATYGNISNVQQANPNLPPKGYADGGWINEPIWGVGASGQTYTFGENEAEFITPRSKMLRGSGGRGVAIRVEMPDTMTVRIGEQEFDAAVTVTATKVVTKVINDSAQSR